MQQLSRESRKSWTKGVLNLTPLMLIAPTRSDWITLGSESEEGSKSEGRFVGVLVGCYCCRLVEVETGQSAVGGREQVFHVGRKWDEGMSKEESALSALRWEIKLQGREGTWGKSIELWKLRVLMWMTLSVLEKGVVLQGSKQGPAGIRLAGLPGFKWCQGIGGGGNYSEPHAYLQPRRRRDFLT